MMKKNKVLIVLLSFLQVFTISFGTINFKEVKAEAGKFLTAPPNTGFDASSIFQTVPGTNSYFDTTHQNTIVITNNSSNQKGATWSDFKFNFTQNFNFSMYLYWGPSTDAPLGGPTQKGGDGMTITFQNDPLGKNAIGGIGGGIGAYKRPGISTETFIKNSISFEIDPFVNGGDFDSGMAIDSTTPNNSRHVGFVYPNDPLGQSKHKSLKSFANVGISGTGDWVPVDINWTPGANNSGVFSAYINGILVQHTITNYLTTFGGTQAYVGFTGATGNATALQAIAIIDFPGMYLLDYDLNGATSEEIPAEAVNFGGYATPVTPPTREGYTFLGWNTAANGSGMMWDFATSTMPDNNVTLYAQWSINSYTLSYDLNGGVSIPPINSELVVYNGLATPVTPPTREGYTFLGWNTAIDGSGTTWNFATTRMPANNTVLFAQWSANSYQLSYNLNGAAGIPPATQNVAFEALATPVADPVRTGYAFIGWNTAANGSGTTWNFTTTKMPANNVVLYAQWTQQYYSLMFNINGGDGSAPTNQSLPYNSLATPVANPIRTGHTFIGWNTAIDGSGTTWNFATTLMPANNVTLYAQWSANSYTLSFNVNGGESVPPATQTVVYNTLATPVTTPTRTGYTFIGWNSAANGSGTTWNFATTMMPANNVTLYAQWSINSYSLSFNVNGGESVPPATQTVVYNTAATPVAPPTRVGYTFAGWNTAINGTGTYWDFVVSRMPANNVVLYAQWNVNSYTLSFNVNGGVSIPPTSQNVNYDALATPVAPPTRVGYTFTGWNTAIDGSGTAWNFVTTRMPASNVTLFAQWSINSYSLSFNVNGGDSVAPATQTVVYNTLATPVAPPTRVGYTFTGWNTAANGSGTTWNFATTMMPGNNVVLYAQWSVNTYTLSFNVNGGISTPPASQSVIYNGLATPVTNPTRTGYTFTGWNTAANGSGTTWDFATTTMPANDVVLYAQWIINSYTLSFNVNGGDSATPANQTVVYNDLATPVVNPTRVGYTFTGWNSAINGAGLAWDFATTTMPAGDVTLYAQWSVNSYSLSFNVNGGDSATPANQTVVYNGLATPVVNPTRVGYIFNGWNSAIDGSGYTWDFATTRMPASNVIVYAQWIRASYSLSFNVNGGDSVAPIPQNVEYNTAATPVVNPTRVGYTFTGWNTNADGSGTTWDFATSLMPANNVTLYAQWDINSYTLSFNVNGGNSAVPPAQTVEYNGLATAVAAPTRIGYSFTGWNTSADGSGTMWNFATTLMPASNVTLFAQWSVNSYSLSFNVNGGTSTPPVTQTVVYNTLATPVATPTKTGYTFTGWNTSADGSGTTWNFATSLMPANDVLLYAQWSINSYSLSFNVNGGASAPPATQTVVYDALATPVVNPTRVGYTFTGWNSAIDGSGYSWDFATTRMPAQNVILYAQWSVNTYTLSYDINGGSGAAPAPENVNYNSLATPVTPPTRTGYTFTGWNSAANGGGTTWNFATSLMPANNVVLYAQWSINSYTVTFNVNGGNSTPPATQTVAFQSLVTPVADPTRIGYTFVGWNNKIDGSGIYVNFATSLMPAQNVILYAQWSINSYTLSYELNGATGTPPGQEVVKYDSLATPVVNPTRIGYTFTGWNTAANGSGTTWNFATSKMPANNVTLYAQWSINSYTLNFDVNGGESANPIQQTVVYNTLATAVANPTRTGHTFVGWNTAIDGSGTTWDFASTTMPGNNVVLYAQWSPELFNLDFNLNGAVGTPPAPQIVAFGDLATPVVPPTRTGYTFTEWNSAIDGSGITWDFATTTMPNTAIILYAQWDVNEYIVKYSINGGTSAVPPEETVAYQSLATPVVDPTRIGHTFMGWNTAVDGSGVTWDFATNIMPASNVTLSAQWSINAYTMHYDVNGGDGIAPPNQTVNYGSLVTTVTNPTRVGYTFTEWNTALDGSGVTWNFATNTMPANDVTLFAQWSINDYQLSFNVNGGASAPPATQTVEYQSLATPVAPPTRLGYTFVGWNSAIDGSGESWDFATTLMPENNVVLFAQWSINAYTVAYDVNGGDGPTIASEVVSYNNLVTPVTPPTRTGYIFLEWNTAIDGTGQEWDFGLSTMPANDITLYAQWSVNDYLLRFNVNGGSSATPANQTLEYNELATPVTPPTRTGYTFTVWNTLANGSGESWDFATSRMPASNLTLYAQWGINSYNLSFNVNGGESMPPATQTVVYNTAATPVTNPTRIGHTFAGWNTEVDGTGTYWDFVVSRMPANNVVLYAQWNVNEYQLSFNVNGGSSIAPTTQTLDYQTLATPVTPPTRLGYTFTGWNTSVDGSGVTWDFATTTMPANNTILFAQWSINGYTVNYDNNGGNGPTIASEVVNYNQLVTPVTPPTRTGYTFIEWNTVADGSGIVWDFATNTMPANNVTLFAQWDVNSYTLSFNVNGGSSSAPTTQTLDYQTLATPVAPPTRAGYTFTGWNTVIDGSGITWDFATTLMPASNTVLFAQWSINDYTLSYNINGGDGPAIASENVEYNSLVTPVTPPTRVGYTFTEWNTVIDGSGIAWNFATTLMPANNVVLFAQWSINDYTVSYNINGGDGPAIASENVEYNSLVTPVTSPTRTGYTFIGWNSVIDGSGITWDFATTLMPANNVVLFAQWNINSYNLAYNLNGDLGIPPNSEMVVFGSLATPVISPTRVGYTFIGWNSAADGSGVSWNFATNTMPANDVTLYAQWDVNTYTLNFDVNGGESVPPTTQNIDYGALATPVASPTRVGYTFTGWNTIVDGSGVTWDFATNTMPANNTTLFAQWSVNSYVISYNLNGGTSGVVPSETVNYGGLATPVVNPTRIGYTFASWNTTIDGSGVTWNFATNTMPANNVTLYAQWTINSYELSYNLNGGTSGLIPSETIAYGGLATQVATPTREGYTFVSWNTNMDGSGTTWNFATTTMPANNVVLYAQWSIEIYTLSFDINGGIGDAPPSQAVEYQGLATPVANPVRIGYTFTGWNTIIDGTGLMWDFATTIMPDNHTVLYAQWSINSYTLSFNVNGGSSLTPPNQTVTYQDLATPVADPIREGYTFIGWNSAIDGSGFTIDFTTTTMPARNVTLHAQWSVNSYVVVYDYNIPIRAVPPFQIVPYGELLPLQEDPVLVGYDFIGWNTVADGSGVMWDLTTTTMPAEDIRLYAQWVLGEYILSYDLNGGNGVANSEVLNYEDYLTPVSPPTKEGYSFIGWNTSINGSGVMWNFATMTMPGHDMVLYAQYEKNPVVLPETGNDSLRDNIILYLISMVGIIRLRKYFKK